MYSLPLNMILHCVVLLCFLNCVRTSQEYDKLLPDDHGTDFTKMFSAWPSMHNAAKMMRNRREVAEPSGQLGQSEAGVVDTKPSVPLAQEPVQTHPTTSTPPDVKEPPKHDTKETPKITAETPKDAMPKVPVNTTDTASIVVSPVVHDNETKANITVTDKSTAKEVDFNNPGVLKRGLIVFGGFALMAVAYFIFYRRKGKKNDANNTSTIDANQFRYGVLQSEDQRDNLELSRVPLTMESDDDEDEDLEIFDLEQKKKSLSYVNLQMNDEDIVLNAADNRGNERDNLLLDIDDANSETLINWSSNGNKSIL